MICFIARDPPAPSQAARRRWLADPDLLLSIAARLRQEHPPEPTLVDGFSHILHDLRIAGTWKRTNRGRLPTTERMIAAHLVADPVEQIAVLDLGASDGITTLELVRALQGTFGERVRVYLTDTNLWLYRYRGGPFVEYRAAGGEPVMARLGRLGLRLSRHRQPQEEGDLLAALYMRWAGFRRAMRLDTRISLVHPLVQREPAITTMELDCLVPEPSLTGRFAAVRASNVLNLGYFGIAELNVATANIHTYLREGGCFVVSRNDGGPEVEIERGSVWRKADDRFVHLADFGGGSEVKDPVTEWRRA